VPIRPLPEDPSPEHLKKLARRLLEAARAGHFGAQELFAEFHPRAAEARTAPKLADAQLVLARQYGFASWAKLKRHLEVVAAHSFRPANEPEDRMHGGAPLAERFLRLACLDYGAWRPEWVERARQLLAEQPELAAASLHAAAAAGDVSAARNWLERDATLVAQRGGPFGWEPLLYAAYSRLADEGERSTLEVARLLLARGADPNAGFLWRSNVPPFTALTGAFGAGEDGANQPPHPRRDALARLLLEAGADPNDAQTLYNRHFGRDDGHLVLLLEFGLGRARGGPWFARLGERMPSPRRMLAEELWSAARKGYAARVRLLLAHGVDADLASERDGRTPYEAALLSGQREIAELLVRHGARHVELEPLERLASACVAGDAAAVQALLALEPGLLDALERQRRAEILLRAVEARSAPGIRLMAELGFDLSPLTRNTPLHDAAWAGELELVRLLVELGADPTVRDPHHNSSPLGWAAHNHQSAVVEYLLDFADVFDLVQQGELERVRTLLRAEPASARASDARGNPLIAWIPGEHPNAAQLLALLVAHGADLEARDRNGQTPLEAARAAGRTGLVRLLEQRARG
jgi:ankyrin repeat protein